MFGLEREFSIRMIVKSKREREEKITTGNKMSDAKWQISHENENEMIRIASKKNEMLFIEIYGDASLAM